MEVFSVNFQQNTKIDDRIKIVLILCALIAMLGSTTPWIPVFLAGVSLLTLYFWGVKLVTIIKHLKPAILLGALIAIMQMLAIGSTPIVEINLKVITLAIYEEGLVNGIHMFTRIFGGLSLILLLTLSSNIRSWANALAWFRVPSTVIEILVIAYNSIYVLIDEFKRLYRAQQMRFGYSSWWGGLNATSQVAGTLVIRVFERSFRLWTAVKCRGFEEQELFEYDISINTKDLIFLILGLITIFGSWFIL